MLRRLLRNTRKPEGLPGRLILWGMNAGHAPLSEWALTHLPLKEGARVLDVGCGGGANISRLLKRCPRGFVDGIDLSAQSVAVSRRVNRRAVGTRCAIVRGDVSALPYEARRFDAAIACETVYFWPDLGRAFAEIGRVLRHGGRFLIACEAGDPRETTWTSRIDGMVIHSGEELRARLERVGFGEIAVSGTSRGWLCVLAVWRPEEA